jgi:mono/diheme cytochrome c family protein
VGPTRGSRVRKVWLVSLLLVAAVAAIALTGCVDSSQSEAETPSNATTVVNSALQTDSNGKTISAPASTSPAAPSGGGASTSGAAPSGGGAAVKGDVAGGKTFFAATCTACHMQDGMAAGGIGPKLAGSGFDADTIRNQVVNGGGPMPAGLATGKDLDNVVAYVLSIQ